MKLRILSVICVALFAVGLGFAQADKPAKEAEIVVVEETGKAELGDKTKTKLKDATKAEALRKAVERVSGVYVKSRTEVKDFEIRSDDLLAISEAYVQGVQELDYTYDKLSETGIYKGRFTINTGAMGKMIKSIADANRDETSNAGKNIQINFAFYDGNNKRLEEGSIVQTGERYQLMIEPSQKCHVYIINLDAKGNVVALFPRSEIRTKNPLESGRRYYFPGSDNDYAFDNVTGTENFYIVASLSPLTDIDSIFNRIHELKDKNAAHRLASAAISRAKTRGGGHIVNKFTGEKVNATTNKNAEVVVEKLKAQGSLVRQIILIHR